MQPRRTAADQEVRRRYDHLSRPGSGSLVEDAAGGDPIVYEDDSEQSQSYPKGGPDGLHDQRSQ
jgi:hypothetical protein